VIRLLFRLIRLIVFCLVLGIGLYLGGPYLLTAIGQYLVAPPSAGRADLLVVLAGEPYLRVPEAARLYHEGQGAAILLTGEVPPPGFAELRQQGIEFPDSQDIALAILAAMRVPRSAVLTIAERADTTRAEMEAVGRFLRDRPSKRLTLVTSRSHTGRAVKIFTTGLGSAVRIQANPPRNDPFDPAGWWRKRADYKQVLYEYAGLADFWRIRFWEWAVGWLRSAPPVLAVREVSRREQLRGWTAGNRSDRLAAAEKSSLPGGL